MLLGAWLTREGIFAQEAYDARRVARRPAFPRKIAGRACWSVQGLRRAHDVGRPVLSPRPLASSAPPCISFSFGPDPLRDKGMEGIDTFQTDRVARAVDEGETYLKGMKDAILRASDRQP